MPNNLVFLFRMMLVIMYLGEKTYYSIFFGMPISETTG